MICKKCAENREDNREMVEKEITDGKYYYCPVCLESIKIIRQGNEIKTQYYRAGDSYRVEVRLAETGPIDPQKTIKGRGIKVPKQTPGRELTDNLYECFCRSGRGKQC